MIACRDLVRTLRLRALLLGSLVALLAACGSSVATTQPTTATASGAASASGPAATTMPATALPTATPASEPPSELVIGCLSVSDAECRFLVQHVLTVLPADRGAPFAIEIQLFRCENPEIVCPETLDTRQGKAVVEYADGEEPIDLSLIGPSLAPTIAAIDTFYLGLAHPSSSRVAGQGPFLYDMGHCGVTHVIDFDGSFWLPVGQVDGDHPTIINAESGTMRLLDPDLAEFHGDSGFVVQLARFPGPKHFWGCD